MTEQEIKDSNKIIAEFMNVDGNDANFYASKQLHENANYHYHKAWVWLMSVIEKIENISDVDYTELYSEVSAKNNIYIFRIFLDTDTSHTEPTFKVASDNKMDAIYSCVVEFIEWYNTQPK